MLIPVGPVYFFQFSQIEHNEHLLSGGQLSEIPLQATRASDDDSFSAILNDSQRTSLQLASPNMYSEPTRLTSNPTTPTTTRVDSLIKRRKGFPYRNELIQLRDMFPKLPWQEIAAKFNAQHGTNYSKLTLSNQYNEYKGLSGERLPLTSEQKELLVQKVKEYGTKWAYIQKRYLPQFAPNELKNAWYSHQRTVHRESENQKLSLQTITTIPKPVLDKIPGNLEVGEEGKALDSTVGDKKSQLVVAPQSNSGRINKKKVNHINKSTGNQFVWTRELDEKLVRIVQVQKSKGLFKEMWRAVGVEFNKMMTSPISASKLKRHYEDICMQSEDELATSSAVISGSPADTTISLFQKGTDESRLSPTVLLEGKERCYFDSLDMLVGKEQLSIPDYALITPEVLDSLQSSQ